MEVFPFFPSFPPFFFLFSFFISCFLSRKFYLKLFGVLSLTASEYLTSLERFLALITAVGRTVLIILWPLSPERSILLKVHLRCGQGGMWHRQWRDPHPTLRTEQKSGRRGWGSPSRLQNQQVQELIPSPCSHPVRGDDICHQEGTTCVITTHSFPEWEPLLFSLQVVSNSLWPFRLQLTRLPCPSLSPGVCSNSCPLS